MEVWVSLRSRTLPSSSGPNDEMLARTWAPLLPDSDRTSSGWPAAWNAQPIDSQRDDDLGVGRVAGRADAGDVALHVDREDRDAERGQLAGEDLEGLGLAGAGRAGDKPVPIDPGQRDLDAHVLQDLVAEHRRAQRQGRLVQRIAGGHLVAKGLVHDVLRGVSRAAYGTSRRQSSAARGYVPRIRTISASRARSASAPTQAAPRHRRRGQPRRRTPSASRGRSTAATPASRG